MAEGFQRPEDRNRGGSYRRGGERRRNEPPAGKPKGPWKLKLGWRRLQELKEKPSNDIMLAFSSSKNALKDALDDTNLEDEMIALFLRCLAKSFECSSLTEIRSDVIIILKDSNFVKLLLPVFLMRYTRTDVHQVLIDIICICKEMAIRIPKGSMTIVLGINAVLDLVLTGPQAHKSCTIDKSVLEAFEECKDITQKMLRDQQKRVEKKTFKNFDEEEPPDDFREYPVFPDAADIQPQAEEKLFLRRNRMKGGYKDVDDYLDVQFRLLREDFICPLREGVEQYLGIVQKGETQKSLQDIRIYNNVQILSPVCSNNGLSHRVSFSTEKLQRVRWESSKRLIYGSLVCLSSDNFKTLMFATVSNRDKKDLKDGIVDLKFETGQISSITRDTIFIMAETTAYFESYRHVLQGLQNIHDVDLPFQKYLVHCEPDVNPPAYLDINGETTFDLRPLIDDQIILLPENRKNRLSEMEVKDPEYQFTFQSHGANAVPLTDFDKWPTAQALQLDTSQYEAIRMALTKEFVITQGPPGTGKTYVGLKIAKALLHNYSVWNKDPITGETDHRPLLVVCYTNHALDQFLEGILSFYKGDVLRVGGRSSSETMKTKNIRYFRNNIRARREVSEAIHRTRWDLRQTMEDLEKSVNQAASRIQKAEKEILHEDTLRPFMKDFYQQIVSGVENFLLENDPGFSRKQLQKHACIVEWLGYGQLINVEHGTEQLEDDMQHDLNIEQGVENMHLGEHVVMGENDEETVNVEDDLDHIEALRMLEDEFDEILNFSFPQEMQGHLGMNSRRDIGLNVSNIDDNAVYDQSGWEISKKERKKLKRRIRKELSSTERMTTDETELIFDIWDLSLRDKWRLYRSWVAQYCDERREEIRGKEEEFEQTARRYHEILLEEDKEVIRRATVVGMTTTGAAKYQSVLQDIGPRIVIVEEAAEVLEAHVITTLSRGCQHLILIGDHKQLKPNPTVYKLATQYNLELSLFERMIVNDMDYRCLHLQHRMRPLISGLMKIIYPELQDHNVVTNYPDVKGISSNMRFIHHQFPESKDEDQRSHSNEYEANFIVGLCNYLLLQGYRPEQITVLTLYSGQLFQLKKLMPKERYNGVRVTVVDNFQGEESDIILMSLVRSNKDGKIGFLKIENRVCVALSRAKVGLYVIGNLNLMKAQSKLWKDVVVYAQKTQCYGEELFLYCQNHPNDESIVVANPTDFNKAPEGGCKKPCQFRLQCGHVCRRVCHITDQDHKEYECRAPCQKKLCSVPGHRCLRQCFQNCGSCQVPVEKIIPKCGHKKQAPCSTPTSEIFCVEKCHTRLPCGHCCRNLCGERHTERCTEIVQTKFSCGHTGDVQCYLKDKAVCPYPCREILQCEHPCGGTCGKCLGGRLHIPCTKPCARILVCGHECQDKCSVCSPCKRKCQNRCKHSTCQKKCGENCIPCMEECEWQCPHFRCSKVCSEPCDRPRCNRPCRKRLPCGHGCIGLCGEPCPQLCRVCNNTEVTEIFFGDEDEPYARFVELEDCGHIIEYRALDRFIDEGMVDNGQENIKLRECPKCRTEIRRNLRYGNIIKQTLQDLEGVKKVIRGNAERIETHKLTIRIDLRSISQTCNANDVRRIKENYSEVQNHEGLMREDAFLAIANQIEFLKKMKSLQDAAKDDIFDVNLRNVYHENVEALKDWVLRWRPYFTEQEMLDLQSEFSRLDLLKKVLCYYLKVQHCDKLDRNLREGIFKAKKIVLSKTKLTEDMKKNILKLIETIKKEFPSGLNITETERLQILKAVGLSKGHWYKCQNGHIYAIGECGGANQGGRCPECGSAIGGQNHALATGNTVATEMDGARYAAWSEQANLENYLNIHDFD